MNDSTYVDDFIVDETGIYYQPPVWNPVTKIYDRTYNMSTLILPREVFIEAYNRYIRDDTSSNIFY